MTEATAAQQIEALKQQLLEAYVKRDKARSEIDELDKTILAIRNVMMGIPIGQALAQPTPVDPPAD